MAITEPASQDATRQTLETTHPNPSLQVTRDHKIKLVDAPVHAPGPGEALLHIKVTGICGSDMHLWKRGCIGPLVVEDQYILGHEAAGVVLKCGPGVTNVKPGDRVAIEPGAPCEDCFLCRDGRYNLCDDVAFAGVYPSDGTCRRYMTHPAKWLHKIPSSFTFSEAALLEPLSVALAAVESAHPTLGRPVLVCGAGPIGLVTLASVRAAGAHPIVVTDVVASRLAFARELVPGVRTYQFDTAKNPRANAAAIRELFTPEWEGGVADGSRSVGGGSHDEYHAPRVVFECTGAESSIITACYTARRGGAVFVIGLGKPDLNGLPFIYMSLAEIDLRFINRYHDTWPAGINLISGKLLDLKKMVTHSYPLEKAIEAFELCANTASDSIKIHVVDDVDAGLVETRSD